MVVCPGCKSSEVREVAVSKRRRAECAGCGRFVAWVTQVDPVAVKLVVEEVVAESPTQTILVATTWLFVSRRLDILEVPNDAFWAAPAFTAGDVDKPVAYYRLTADVVVWLEAAGAALEYQFARGEVGRDQVDAYLAAMDRVWEFARSYIGADAICKARKEQPVLPEVGGPK